MFGCGDVGIECTIRFKAFGCHFIGLNRIVNPKRYFDEIVPLKELSEEVKQVDILVLPIVLKKIHIIFLIDRNFNI